MESHTNRRLARPFYLQDTLSVAKALIGKTLVHETREGVTAGKIVETEAYIAPMDRACHAYGGRQTPRTQPLYALGGIAYVYLIYGMHCCLNLVTAGEGCPECVLIRALEPALGLELMAARRNQEKAIQFCSGPGKLCQAMGIDRTCNWLDLCASSLYLLDAPAVADKEIIITPRINIAYAKEAAEYPWRFYLSGNPHVSVKAKK